MACPGTVSLSKIIFYTYVTRKSVVIAKQVPGGGDPRIKLCLLLSSLLATGLVVPSQRKYQFTSEIVLAAVR